MPAGSNQLRLSLLLLGLAALALLSDPVASSSVFDDATTGVDAPSVGNVLLDVSAADGKVDETQLLTLERLGTRAGLEAMAIVAIVVSCIVAVMLCSLGFVLLCGVLKPASQAESGKETDTKVLGAQAEDHHSNIQRHIASLEAKMSDLKAQEGTTPAVSTAAAVDAQAGGGEGVKGDMHLKNEAGQALKAADEGVKAAEERLRQAEATAEQLRDLTQQAAQKTEQLEKMVVEHADKALQQLETFVRETVQSLTVRIEEAIAAEASEDEVEALTKEAEDAAGQALRMPLPLLLAGLLAPMQLKVMVSWNSALLLLQFPALISLMVVMFMNFGVRCGGNELWVWAGGMAFMLKLSVTFRLWVLRQAGDVLFESRAEESTDSGLGVAGHPFYKFCKSFMSASKDYFKALLAYDGIATSFTSSVVSFTSFVLFIWGGVGVYFVIANAVDEERFCEANSLRAVARVFAFFYLVAFFISLIALVVWIVEMLLTSKRLALLVLEKVWQFDDQYSPVGFPVVSILVRALLLRSDKDMKSVEASILRSEIAELKEKKAELAKREAHVNKMLETTTNRLKAASQETKAPDNADELSTLYSRDLIELVDKVAIFTLAVQEQVRRLSPDGAMEESQLEAGADSRRTAAEVSKSAASSSV